MSEVKRSSDVGRIVFGLGVVALGVIFTLGNLEVIDAGEYWQYWPALLIVFGLGKLLERRSGGKMFGFVVAVVGTLLLLERLGKIAWDVWDLWPLLLVVLGISILWGGFCKVHVGRRAAPEQVFEASLGGSGRGSAGPGPSSSQTDTESTINVSTTFGGISRVVTSQDFRGGSISTIMGGCDIDLRGAAIAGPQAVLHISAVFGGVELRVPDSWKVTSEINPVLGGVEVKTPHTHGQGAKTLLLTGSVVLGGVEVTSAPRP
jgi:predicted membrane protein